MNSKEANMKFWNGVCKTNPAETKTGLRDEQRGGYAGEKNGQA